MAVKLGESQGEFVHSSVQYDLTLQEMYAYHHLNKSCVMYYEILEKYWILLVMNKMGHLVRLLN